MRGKIIKGIAGFYYVDTNDGDIYECRARGIFRNQQIKPLVGDDCEIEVTDSDMKKGSVIEILPRKNQLLRPPVTNVDQVLIVFAIVKPDPSYNLLDRFLITMRMRELPVIICFNKQDIATKKEQQELSDAYEKCGYKVMFMSVQSNQGIDDVRKLLTGKTTVLAGPSGVGKSSLLNVIYPEAAMETGELSRKISRGKNTTRHSELFRISCGDNGVHTYVMDTPGFTSLYLKDISAGDLCTFYPEFEQFEPECRFGGCVHMSEPDCGIKKAVQEGKISTIRYDNYRVLYNELKDQKPVYRKK